MKRGLHALLLHAIDYAGLFPPAGLPLEEAIGNYARYRKSADSWMLASFVIPVGRLSELTVIADRWTDSAGPARFSVLGSFGSGKGDWLSALDADLRALASFLDRHRGCAEAPQLELKLPEDFCDPSQTLALEANLSAAVGQVRESPLPELMLLCEPPRTANWARHWAHLASALAGHSHRTGFRWGFKLRAGGLTASSFPTVDEVAAIVAVCRDYNLCWKATAGLHHAVRQYRAEVGTHMHGFLNLLAATVVARSSNLSQREIAAILAEEDAARFAFSDQELCWGDHRADLLQIDRGRKRGIMSLGSCSFDEPREDLMQLGLW